MPEKVTFFLGTTTLKSEDFAAAKTTTLATAATTASTAWRNRRSNAAAAFLLGERKRVSQAIRFLPGAFQPLVNSGQRCSLGMAARRRR